LSLKKSAQPIPPCPSYNPKKEHLGQGISGVSLKVEGFEILKIIATLSSL
jgi:hypothetical protein